MAAKTTKELSDEEIEDYKEAFSNFDKDGNGNIDEGELGVVMRSLGYSPTNQQLKEMMAKVCRSMLYAEVYRARLHALMLYMCMIGFCCPRMHHVEIRGRLCRTPARLHLCGACSVPELRYDSFMLLHRLVLVCGGCYVVSCVVLLFLLVGIFDL